MCDVRQISISFRISAQSNWIVGRSENLKGRLVIQGQLKMKIVLLFLPKVRGGTIPPFPLKFHVRRRVFKPGRTQIIKA